MLRQREGRAVAAMSITAFPMLARIIYERGITGSSLGTFALAAGAIDDEVFLSLKLMIARHSMCSARSRASAWCGISFQIVLYPRCRVRTGAQASNAGFGLLEQNRSFAWRMWHDDIPS
jgi:hypothetical protein